MWRQLQRTLFTTFVWCASHLCMRITIEGQEHFPEKGPLIIICNHFSWFEIPLLYLYTPYGATVLGASELQEMWIFRWLFPLYNIIPVKRGQIDRAALKQTAQLLQQERTIIIFPEGGIDPTAMAQTAQGIAMANDTDTKMARLDGQLVAARPGVAYLATQNNARILPTAVLNGEQVLANLKKWRRTDVTFRIGPSFGPFLMDPGLRGSAKRDQLNAFGDEMMQQIAALMPKENHGVYRLNSGIIN